MSKQSLGRVAMVPKGAYNALTAYERLDVVTHDGASYIVLRPVQGVTPVDGEDYMLLVQDGDTPDLSVGTVKTLAAGSKATATIGGTPDKPVLNLSIPKGDTGAAPVLKMGKVTTLEPGSEATASLTGTAEEPELNLNIPRGASGGVDVASAEVGQTIIVKAVDENGKPIEWEAADMGSEKVELISSGTVAEEITQLWIEVDNDGNAFRLKHCSLIVSTAATPSNTSDAAARIRVNGNTAASNAFANSIPRVFRNNAPNGCGASIVRAGKSLQGLAWSSASTVDAYNDEFDAITSIVIAGGVFGVGSTWELWGVRE